MLSVLIPVFNYNIKVLVKSLISQSIDPSKFEIIVCDDSSNQRNICLENEDYCQREGVTYLKNYENIGRTETRAYLASQAQFKYLLFIDADMRIDDLDFCKKISRCLSHQIIFGGIDYAHKPQQESQLLRWYYGKCRESRNLVQRQKQVYQSIVSGCFVIEKSCFLRISQSLQGNQYGMDTLFSYLIEQEGISVRHIDNPAVHMGLESCSVFLRKTRQGIDTLIDLSCNKRIPKDYRKLQKVFLLLQKLRLEKLFSYLFSKGQYWMESRIRKFPSQLIWFDLYRIAYFCYKSN